MIDGKVEGEIVTSREQDREEQLDKGRLTRGFNDVSTGEGGLYEFTYNPAVYLGIQQKNAPQSPDNNSTEQTSSIGVSTLQDRLITAAHASGDDIGFIGRADHFGHGELLKTLMIKLKKQKEKFTRDIMHLSLQRAMDMAGEFINDLKTHAQDWRDQQAETLDHLHDYQEAIPKAMIALDNGDLARDEQGRYINTAAQTVTEAVLMAEGKMQTDMQGMSDAEARAKLDYGLDHADEISQILTEKSEREGDVADVLERSACDLKQSLIDIRKDPALSDEQKIKAIHDRAMEANDQVIKELKDIGVEDGLIKEIVHGIQIDQDAPLAIPENPDNFLNNLKP